MMAPPSHTITNTSSKSSVLSSAEVAAESVLIVVREGDLRGQHEAEEKGAPEVPVADFLAFVYFVSHRFNWVDHNSQLGPNAPQVSFLKS